MPSDPNQPAQKPTITMESVPPWAVDIKMGMQDLARHLDRQDTTLDDQNKTLKSLSVNDARQTDKMHAFELRLDAIEERQTKTSIGVRQTSDHSLEADAKLAEIIVWRQSVATKDDLAKTTAAQTTALLTELRTNPWVHKILWGIGGAISAYLATKGIHLL